MRLRILLVVVLLVVGLGAAVYVVLDPPSGSTAASQFLTAQATTTDVVEQAVATGAVAAHATYGLGFGRDPALIPSGATASGATSTGTWVVNSINVKLGDRVTKGTVLATSDDSDAQLALQVAQADLTAAQAKLDTDQGGPTSLREGDGKERRDAGRAAAEERTAVAQRHQAPERPLALGCPFGGDIGTEGAQFRQARTRHPLPSSPGTGPR